MKNLMARKFDAMAMGAAACVPPGRRGKAALCPQRDQAVLH